jgi:DNA-binding IclR family transcriptional regulator
LAAQRFNLLDMALDSLTDLAALSGDTVFLSVRRDAFSVCIHKEEGAFPIRTNALEVGYRHPLGVGAGSLAMLAALPEDERFDVLARNRALLARDFPACEPAQLEPLIAQAHERGFSLNPGLVLKNSWAVGVALRQPGGRVLGAISIAAIDSRMGAERQLELGAALLREAVRVETRLAKAFALPNARKPSPPRRSAGQSAAVSATQ